jgi:transcriptional regulator with XRE-family HTH domain
MSRSAGPKLLRAYGRVLRGRREVADLTQEDLLGRVLQLGLKAPNRATISSLENGHEEPRLGMLFKLARALGVRPSEMLREVEEMILPLSEHQRMDRGTDAKIRTSRLVSETKLRPKAPRAK